MPRLEPRPSAERPRAATMTGRSISPSADVAIRPQRLEAPLALGVMLLLSGVLAGLAPALGVVHFADGSPVRYAEWAAWVAVLPGVLTLALAAVRPVYGLAAATGGGIMGLAQLVTNIGVFTNVDGVARPELFYETTDRAQPFTVTSGAYLLLAADILAIVVGVVAATRLADAVAVTADDDSRAAVTDTMTLPVVVPFGFGPGRTPRRARNNPLTVVGFVGAILLLAASLNIPYSGGYLALRLIPPGASLAGVFGAVLFGILSAAAVITAGVLPRGIALSLLAGAALAAAVPSLTALVAVLSAPTSLAAAAWIGVLGAVVLVLAGLLARFRLIPRPAADPDGRPASAGFQRATAGVILLGGGCALAAFFLPQLLLDGSQETILVNGYRIAAPLSLPWLVAAVPLLIVGVLAFVPPVARIGQAAATVVWAGPLYALTLAISLLSLVVASANNPLNAGLPRHAWTAGPGLWVGFVAVVTAVFGAVLGAIAAYRTSQAQTLVPDDEALATSRTMRGTLAGCLVVLAVFAFGLPTYADAAGGSAALFSAWGADTFGVLMLLLGVAGALVGGVASTYPPVSAALCVAAAAMAAVRLAIPAAVSAQPSFHRSSGFLLGIVLVITLLLAAVAFAVLTARMRMVSVDLPGPPAFGVDARQVHRERAASGKLSKAGSARRGSARTRR